MNLYKYIITKYRMQKFLITKYGIQNLSTKHGIQNFLITNQNNTYNKNITFVDIFIQLNQWRF